MLQDEYLAFFMRCDLGSQVFDYWWDPDGFRMEHYTDGDLYDNQASMTTVEATREQLWTRGPEVPATFVQQTRER